MIKRLMLKFHPDKNPDKNEICTQLTQVGHAIPGLKSDQSCYVARRFSCQMMSYEETTEQDFCVFSTS